SIPKGESAQLRREVQQGTRASTCGELRQSLSTSKTSADQCPRQVWSGAPVSCLVVRNERHFVFVEAGLQPRPPYRPGRRRPPRCPRPRSAHWRGPAVVVAAARLRLGVFPGRLAARDLLAIGEVRSARRR